MKTALMLIPCLLAGCFARVPADQGRVLANGALRCVDLGHVVARRVERGRIVMQLSSGTSYSNHLQGNCPALARATGGEIIETLNDGQLCRGDALRIYDPVTVRVGGPAGVLRCRAGDFTPMAGR